MDEQTAPPRAPEPRALYPADWLLWLGLVLTAIWIGLGFIYILEVLGPIRFINQGADQIGGFLEGAFAPLAFLWLVIGFFLQQRELDENTRAIKGQYEALQRTAENAEIQAKAIAASELHARQETFIKVCEIMNQQLGQIAGMIYLSKAGARFEGALAREGVNALWTEFASHPEVFVRRLLGVHYGSETGEDGVADFLWGTAIRARHTENYRETFERMLAAGESCDPDHVLRNAFRTSSYGLLYRIAGECRPGERESTASGASQPEAEQTPRSASR